MPALRISPALVLALAVAAELPAQQSLTIYNDGRVLMRQGVDVKVPGGQSRGSVAMGATLDRWPLSPPRRGPRRG